MDPITKRSDRDILAETEAILGSEGWDPADVEATVATIRRRERDWVLTNQWDTEDVKPSSTPIEAMMRAGPSEPEESTMERSHPLDEAIESAFSELSEEDRLIAVMTFVEGLSVRQIVKLVGVSHGYVQRSIPRLRATLAEKLSQHKELEDYR